MPLSEGIHLFHNLWNLLRKCAQVDASTDLACLESAFAELPKGDQEETSREFVKAVSSLGSPSVWAVGSLLFGQPLGDDSFRDFRRWLALQGRDLTTVALTAPDELSSILSEHAKNDRIFIEAIHWLEDPALQASNLMQPYADHWTMPDLDEMRKLVPRTFATLSGTYGPIPTDVVRPDHLSVDGLGELRVGDQLLHRGQFGVGVIRAVRLAETGIVDIEFASGLRTMRLSAAFFERMDD